MRSSEPLLPTEESTMSDPAVTALLTRELCLHGGRLTLSQIHEFVVDLSPEHIASIVREEAKRFPQPEPGTVMALSPVRLCAAYLREQCQAPDCQSLHLCRFFVLERCFHRRGRRGGKVCKFSHDISSEVNRAVLKVNGLSDFNEKELRVLLLLNDHSCLPEVCREYKGEKNDASCPKGEECGRLHVCQYFARGQCRYFKCNRSHNLMDPKAIQIMKGRGLGKEMVQNIQLLRIHMCNEARKEPWKEEKPRYDRKGRNDVKDHPRAKAESNTTKENEQPRAPQALCPSHSASDTNDANGITETTSEIYWAEKSNVPQSAILLPPPKKTETTSPTAEPHREFQQPNKSNGQAYVRPPTPPDTTYHRPLLRTTIHTTIQKLNKPDVQKSATPITTPTETLKTNLTAAHHRPIIGNPELLVKTGIQQADKLDTQSSFNSHPPATTASIRTQSINQLNSQVSSPSEVTTAYPAQIEKTSIQPTSKVGLKASVTVSPSSPAYTTIFQTPTRTSSADTSNADVGTSVHPPTPVSKMPIVNPKPVTNTVTTDNNNPYVPLSLSRPPTPASSIITNTADEIYTRRTPATQTRPTEIRRAINRVNADTASTLKGYSLRASTHTGIYEFDPYEGLAPPTRNASQLYVRQVVPTPVDRGDPNEICFYHIWKFCKHQSKCGQIHYHLPYRWQIQKGSKDWEDLPWMEAIEKVYSDPDNSSSGQHDINFEKMTSMYHRVRRLSTASSVTQPPDHLMTTEWVWHWKNELGKWIEYGKHGGKEKATIASADLETIYLADKSSVVPFQAGAQRYEINFKDMIQRNLFYKTEKTVCRRPRFVSKEDVDRLKASTRTSPVAAPPSPQVQGIPAYWDTTALPDPGYKLVDISKHSTEYKEIEKAFGLTMPGHTIQKLQRIQNITLWKFYQMQKDVIKKQNKKDVLEKKLFHGTNVTYVPAICHSNFDWRICGLNGTVYGKGSYFARDASYSHNYCQSSSQSKTMFLARVLVGDFISGHSSYLRPPSKPASQTNYYDSCVDKQHDPSIYVVFEKNQIYPEYLMEYTENKKCCIS